MLDINRVTLLGRAGRDPEIRKLPGGDPSAWFSLATSEKWKRQDGQPAESTEWHRIVVYGGAVKAVEALVRKGAAILVEGRLTVRAYRDKEKNERQVTEIVVAGPRGMVNLVSPKPADRTEPANAPEAEGVEAVEAGGEE